MGGTGSCKQAGAPTQRPVLGAPPGTSTHEFVRRAKTPMSLLPSNVARVAMVQSQATARASWPAKSDACDVRVCREEGRTRSQNDGLLETVFSGGCSIKRYRSAKRKGWHLSTDHTAMKK